MSACANVFVGRLVSLWVCVDVKDRERETASEAGCVSETVRVKFLNACVQCVKVCACRGETREIQRDNLKFSMGACVSVCVNGCVRVSERERERG